MFLKQNKIQGNLEAHLLIWILFWSYTESISCAFFGINCQTGLTSSNANWKKTAAASCDSTALNSALLKNNQYRLFENQHRLTTYQHRLIDDQHGLIKVQHRLINDQYRVISSQYIPVSSNFCSLKWVTINDLESKSIIKQCQPKTCLQTLQQSKTSNTRWIRFVQRIKTRNIKWW